MQYEEIDSQHPSPSPLSGLYHVGICDKREGSQTVREFSYIRVRDSRNCHNNCGSVLVGIQTSKGVQS